MPHTVDDFWAMLWQYNTSVVVMACNEREAGKVGGGYILLDLCMHHISYQVWS
jgi:hypothetical protein